MKVLHYINENNLSWSETWIRLLKQLALNGIDNYVVCKSGGTLSQRLSEKGIAHTEYDVAIAWLPWMARGFGDILKVINPDIIHTRLSSAALIGGWWGKKKHIHIAETLDKRAKIKYYRNADVLFCCSTFVKNDIVQQGFDERRTCIIHNPIDFSYYRKDIKIRNKVRRQMKISDEIKIIIAAGRFEPGKGFELLINAYAKIIPAHPNTRLILLGDGPLKEEYYRLACEHNVDNMLLMPGFIRDIRPFFWASDIFVFPSNGDEAFGIALLEAMASGLAPIATASGGPEEMIFNGKNGLLVKKNDISAMSMALEAILDCENSSVRFSTEATNTAENFSVDKIASSIIAQYKMLV